MIANNCMNALFKKFCSTMKQIFFRTYNFLLLTIHKVYLSCIVYTLYINWDFWMFIHIICILDDFRFRPSIQLGTENPEFKVFYMPYISAHYSLLYFNGYAIKLLAFNLVMFKLKGWYNCVSLMFWRIRSAKLYYMLLLTLNIPFLNQQQVNQTKSIFCAVNNL